MIAKASRVNSTRICIPKLGLDVLPNEVELYPRMTYLEASYNNLISIPSQIVLNNMNALSELYLDYNNLISLPAEIVFLQSLRVLSLNYNNLKELPTKLGQISTLETIGIQGNFELSNLSPAIIDLAKLRTLYHDQSEYIIPGEQIREIYNNILNPTERRRKIAIHVFRYLEFFEHFHITFLPR